MNLDQLLNPTSIAIIGLSDNPEKHGARVLRNLRSYGFAGSVFGVHPRTPPIDGVQMVTTTSDLPAVDLVLSAIPAAAVSEALDGCTHPAAAIVFSGGFGEVPGGANLEAELREIARRRKLRILGPNSGGVIVPVNGLAASFLTCLDRPPRQVRPGPVGVVSQSGGLMSYLHNLAAERGSGIGASISTGNEVDLTVADAITAVAALGDIKSIVLIVETIRDGRGFIDAITAAHDQGVRVVACHLGRSQASHDMLTTHTGAVATDRRVFEGVCRSLGIGTADTPEEALSVAEVLARTPMVEGAGIGVVTHSGGLAILLADLADQRCLSLPEPNVALTETVLPFMQLGAVKNPLDMGAIIGGPGRFASVVEAFASDPHHAVVLAVTSAHPPEHTPERVDSLLAIDSAPIIHLWMAGDQADASLARLREAGAAVVTEPRAAVAALAAAVAYHDRDTRRSNSRPAKPPRTVLSEHASKRELAKLGFPVVAGELVADESEAVEAYERAGGWVVAKISSPDIVHKQRINGLRLGLGSGEQVARAYRELVDGVAMAAPDARLEGVLVERQESVEHEVFLSAFVDGTFGPMIAVGWGGTAVEELDGVVLGLAPIDLATAHRLVARLDRAGSKSLGNEPAAVLASLIVMLGELTTGPDALDIEINPIAWTGSRWVALDAVVRR